MVSQTGINRSGFSPVWETKCFLRSVLALLHCVKSETDKNSKKIQTNSGKSNGRSKERSPREKRDYVGKIPKRRR